jgi:hypothetical protein
VAVIAVIASAETLSFVKDMSFLLSADIGPARAAGPVPAC